jgi:methyl-accepting chemotaxis protein
MDDVGEASAKREDVARLQDRVDAIDTVAAGAEQIAAANEEQAAAIEEVTRSVDHRVL